MTRQYLRAASLVVGAAGGDALDLSSLRFEFALQHASIQTPKTLRIRVSNVARATVARVQNEFTRIVFSAGYQGAVGKLFSGEIRQVLYGRESATDTYMDIVAAEGDQAYTQGFVSQTLAAGHTPADIQAEIAKAASGLGLAVGTAPPDTGRASRPKVMFGPVRDHCRVLAASTGTSWSISDGELNFATLNAARESSTKAVVLNSATGLIGIPKQTIDGVEATCLLNPSIAAGSYVQIATADIAQTQVDTSYGAAAGGNLTEMGVNGRQENAGLSPSGTYRVVYCEHYGDTWGNAWYTRVACFADDGNAVQGQAGLTAVP